MYIMYMHIYYCTVVNSTITARCIYVLINGHANFIMSGTAYM